MSVKFAPVCGLTGCTNEKADTVQVPGVGQRAVCQKHLEELEVNGGV
jgi:imidazoleglycerol phosphate synthase glutamine amidotransferase subunit HisH